jgi:hypothetical protein
VKRARPITCAAVHLLLWTALLALMAGTHQTLRFCVGACCQTSVDESSCREVPGGACCCNQAPRGEEEDGGDCLLADCCSAGCCISVRLAFEHGPLPRRVLLEHGPEPILAVAPEPAPATSELSASACDLCAPATGPPRRDRRTLLLSSTILRL